MPLSKIGWFTPNLWQLQWAQLGEKNANSKIGIWIGNKSDDTLELEVCHGMSHFETRSYLGVPWASQLLAPAEKEEDQLEVCLDVSNVAWRVFLPRTNDGAETIQYPSPGPFSRWAGGGWDWGHGLWLIEWMVNDRMVNGFCLDPWY